MTDNRTTELREKLNKLIIEIERLDIKLDSPAYDMTLGEYEQEREKLLDEFEQAIAATLGSETCEERGTLTADDIRDLIERHSDESGGNGRDFHNGAYVAIADELNTCAERTREACAFSKPTDLTDGCAALERIAELEEECDQLRKAVAYWQRMYEGQIGVRR